METAIVSIICIALIAFGRMTMSRGFISSFDSGATGIEAAGQRNETIMRTEIIPLNANLPRNDTLEITVENSGQTRLADYDKWDIIIQYYDSTGEYHVSWLPFTEETPDDNEWEIAWLRINNADEIFEPGVLNPGEQMLIRAKLNPPVGDNTTNMAVIATPSGITGSTYFSK